MLHSLPPHPHPQPASCTPTSSQTTCWSAWTPTLTVRAGLSAWRQLEGQLRRAVLSAAGCSWQSAAQQPWQAQRDTGPHLPTAPCPASSGCAGNENACPALGLQLIDFGRGVDLELLPPGAMLQVGTLRGWQVHRRTPSLSPALRHTQCRCLDTPMQSWSHGVPGCPWTPPPPPPQGDSSTDAFRCVEMREGRPWLWQADAYGAAATLHALLYGQYMEVERVRDSTSGERGRVDWTAAWPCEELQANAGRMAQDSDHTIRPSLLQARCRCGCASPSSGTGRASCGAPSSTACSTTQVRGAGAVVTRQGGEVGSCVEPLSLLFQFRLLCTSVPPCRAHLPHPCCPCRPLHAACCG